MNMRVQFSKLCKWCLFSSSSEICCFVVRPAMLHCVNRSGSRAKSLYIIGHCMYVRIQNCLIRKKKVFFFFCILICYVSLRAPLQPPELHWKAGRWLSCYFWASLGGSAASSRSRKTSSQRRRPGLPHDIQSPLHRMERGPSGRCKLAETLNNLFLLLLLQCVCLALLSFVSPFNWYRRVYSCSLFFFFTTP